MRALTMGMAAAALLTFGVAKAGEGHAADAAPAGYRIVDANPRIPEGLEPQSFEIVDDHHLLLRVAVRDFYLIELPEYCLREARYHPAIRFDGGGVSGIDRFSRVLVGRERCTMLSLAKVERAPEGQAAPGGHT